MIVHDLDHAREQVVVAAAIELGEPRQDTECGEIEPKVPEPRPVDGANRNNVARITANVLRRFLDPTPFAPPA